MNWIDEVEKRLKKDPEFRRAYYVYEYSDPLPILPRRHSHKPGRDYARRRKNR